MSSSQPFVVTPTAATEDSSSSTTSMDISESSEQRPATNQAAASAAAADDVAMAPPPPPPLPLEWTRVVPRNKRGRNGEECCNLPSCPHRRRSRRRSSDNTTMKSGGLLGVRSAPKAVRRSRVTGQVIFCLHESNPEWFQGYFFPNIVGRAPSSWGLLAVQKELDECLQCAEGGYRVIDLTVTMTPSSSSSSSKKKVTLKDIEWTGGDMMDLKSIVDEDGSKDDDMLSMQTDRLLTGEAAISSTERVFGGLLRTLRASHPTLQDLPVLSLLPDLAIVTGSMTLSVPIDKEEEEKMMALLDQD